MLNFDFKGHLFHRVGDWLYYAKKAVRGLLKYVFRLFYAFIMGVASLIYHFVCWLVRKIRERPLLSVALVTILYIILFLAMFMNMSYKKKTLEYQRDSVGTESYQYKKAYEDLIKYNKEKSESYDFRLTQ